jgi:hypothetical protein
MQDLAFSLLHRFIFLEKSSQTPIVNNAIKKSPIFDRLKYLSNNCRNLEHHTKGSNYLYQPHQYHIVETVDNVHFGAGVLHEKPYPFDNEQMGKLDRLDDELYRAAKAAASLIKFQCFFLLIYFIPLLTDS